MRPRSSVLLAVAAGACLAGCGGGDDPPDPTRDLTPQQVLDRAVDATDGLDAFRLVATMTVQADTSRNAIPGLLGRALSDGLTLDGEGPVNGADASFDFDATLQGLPPIQANLTKIGPRLFVGFAGTDYRVTAPPARVGALVPARAPAALLRWATQPKDVGREEIDGVATIHLRTDIDTRAALAGIVRAAGVAGVGSADAAAVRRSRAQLDAALTTRAVDLWIGTTDFLPRRVTVDLSGSGRVDAIPQVDSIDLTVDLRLDAFGQGVELTAPSDTQVLDLDRLRGLAGG